MDQFNYFGKQADVSSCMGLIRGHTVFVFVCEGHFRDQTDCSMTLATKKRIKGKNNILLFNLLLKALIR